MSPPSTALQCLSQFSAASRFHPSSTWAIQLYNLYSTSFRKAIKSTSSQNGTQRSFTVQYLMNQCGFSMEKAVLYYSKYLNFDNPDQPHSVISFFRNHGFTHSQVRRLVTAEPRILSYNPQKTLLPKIQFLMSKCFSEKDLSRILVPNYFRRSLETCIVPSFNFITDFIGSEKDAILAISNCPKILLKVESLVKPNIEILLGAGMSQSAIARLMESRPCIFVGAQDKLKESIKQVHNMKMDPESCGYILGLSTKARKLISLQNGNRESFTVRYLINHFGFSMEKAVLYSSKYLNFEKPDKPDSVISLFKNHGFTDSQIRKLVAADPRILCSKPQKTLLPKVLFFRSKGFSERDVARILVPTYFRKSLEKYIVPSFNFINDFIGSEKDAIFAISDCPRILLELKSRVKPNIEILLGAGMSQLAIARLMESRPSIFVSAQDKLKESVKQVQNMKMDPESCGYFLALSTKARKLISLQNGNQDSFTVQYLMNHFGFSMEKAVLYSSKYFNFEKPDQPDSVISFFKCQGFTETQIRKVVAAEPRILSYKPQKTLLPKILFLRSKGFFEQDLARIRSLIPAIFRRSLENCIVPSFNFIKDFLASEKDAIFSISDCPRILLELESLVKHNIKILLGVGMSRSAIGRLLKTRPSIFVSGQDKLKESVKQVQNMKLDPESCSYGLALWILTVTRRSRLDQHERMEAYKRWGCSENDVLRSSKSCPNMMKISKERLNGIMGLFVHEIGWLSSEVVKRYFMFELSLNKRLIPRWSVYQELLSKGLVKKKIGLPTMFRMKEDLFLHKFVNLYKDEAPFLLKLYIEKQASK